MIDIDGSYMEGGGQIIRTAIGLSAVTQKPCRIYNIRKGRPEPGLKAQHLAGIRAVSRVCSGKLKGYGIGSEKVEFRPGSIDGGNYNINVGTAGSVALVLQALLIPSIRAKKKTFMDITGGTHVIRSPTTGYFRHVFCEFMKLVGIEITSETLRYGYYPKGGGKIRVVVEPAGNIKPLNITEREGPPETEAWSNASSFLREREVAERQNKAASETVSIDKNSVKYVDSLSPGSSITLAARCGNCFLGSGSVGRRGKPAEVVGREAARALKKSMDSGACFDSHMADQILPYLALADGNSKINVSEITNHCKTNMWVIEKFLPVRFSVENNVISCLKS